MHFKNACNYSDVYCAHERGRELSEPQGHFQTQLGSVKGFPPLLFYTHKMNNVEVLLIDPSSQHRHPLLLLVLLVRTDSPA